jgi:hypothetical protein
LDFSKDLVTEKMGFLLKILQSSRGFRGFKPLCRKAFRVSRLANSLQLPGAYKVRPAGRIYGGQTAPHAGLLYRSMYVSIQNIL